MRAVWSLWTKPLRAGRRQGWATLRHQLLGWILSVETARQHYPHTTLVTDDEGAEMLVAGLGLHFEQVSTALNRLDGHDPEWWAFGKLVAHTLQTEPFVHLDNDVFLWQRLPAGVEAADVCAQNPEVFDYGCSYYRPEQFEFAIQRVGGWLPAEMESYMPVGGVQWAVCCGLVGGNRVDFLRYYANLAIRLIEHPRNRPAWLLLDDKIGDNIIFEQYLLAACLQHHQKTPASPFRQVDIRYLFASQEEAASKAVATGYTHLIGDAKQNPVVLERLEARVRQEYPLHYARCLALLSKNPQSARYGVPV